MHGMATEIEAKFKVDGFGAIRKALRRIGAEHLYTLALLDCYFDGSEGHLLRADSGIRIRYARLVRAGSERPDTRAILAVKGPRQANTHLKIRSEHETPVDNPAALEEALRAAGFRPTMIIEKRRSTHRLGRTLVELDEMPLIGTFVEVEAASERLIASVCRKLGLDGPTIIKPYTDLLAAHCGKAGLSCKEIVFPSSGPGLRHRRFGRRSD